MLVHAQPAPRLGYLGNLLRCGLARPYSPRARPDGASGNGSISCSAICLRRLTGRLGPPGSCALLGSGFAAFGALTEAELQLPGCRRGFHQLLNAFRCLPCALGGDLAGCGGKGSGTRDGVHEATGAIASSHERAGIRLGGGHTGRIQGGMLVEPTSIRRVDAPRPGCRRARHLPQHSGSASVRCGVGGR